MLHYFSNRPGLWPIVVGVLKGMSNDYFKLDLKVCGILYGSTVPFAVFLL